MILDRATMEQIWRSKQIVNTHEIVVWCRVLQGPLNGCLPVAPKQQKANTKAKKK